MKKCFILFFILAPFIGRSQDPPYKSLRLENNTVFFEQIYDCDTMSTLSIQEMLATQVPKIKGLNDFRIENSVITAALNNAVVDYRKFGGKFGTTPAVLNHPFSGNIVVQWKAGKYKITLTNVIFHTAGLGDMELDMLLTKKRKSTWDTRKNVLQIGEFSEKYFTQLFTFQPDNIW